MIKKDVCIVLDTETVGGFDAPIIHDLGYKIVDKHFDTMIAKRFLIKELHEVAYSLLRTSDFYIGKEALYKEAKANNTVKIVTFNEAINEMMKDIKDYKVNCICAYNLGFDLKALKSTYSLFNEGNNEKFTNRLNKLATLCIWNLACDTVLNTDNYRTFAKEHDLVSEAGNYITSAEACFKYLFNSDYEEEHTALADVEDEAMILEYICTNVKGKVSYKFSSQCWRKVQRWEAFPQKIQMKKERGKKEMKKINVYLDMDGTIADLYGEQNWLEDIIAEDTKPFENAKPMTTEAEIYKHFPREKYNISILSMTPKKARREYCKEVEKAKDEWLNKYFPSLTKRIYLPYGYNKNLKNSAKAILVDDSTPIRENYKGLALNPAELWDWVLKHWHKKCTTQML